MKKRALISIYDKRNLEILLKKLEGYELVATGSSAKAITDLGYKVTSVASVTDFPEILHGRVKTLHPNIFGGILTTDNEDDLKDIATHGIERFDVVVCNLYPFFETVSNPNSTDQQIIENIDIGGVSLIRAAAKNFKYVSILIDPNDYSTFDPSNNLMYAKKAFLTTANYDKLIFDYFNNDLFNEPIYSNKVDLSYGENRHQSAKFLYNKFPFEQLHGKELSYNNMLDIEVAYGLSAEFETPCCVAVKHNTPCGVGFGENNLETYENAYACDTESIFGGIVSFNTPVCADSATMMSKIFLEVVIAPDFSDEALLILKQKKNLRILKVTEKIKYSKQVKSCLGGVVVQDYDKNDLSKEEFNVASGSINDEELTKLVNLQRVCKFVKSNAIVLGCNGQIVGIGGGQTSRVESLRQAIKQMSTRDIDGDVYLASDAFFPFADSIELANEVNVKYIIQPGGSIKDKDVIAACDELGINMVLTGVRHFKH